MDPIKEAFDRIKQDIFSLKLEIEQLKHQISELNIRQTAEKKQQTAQLPIQTPQNKEKTIPTMPENTLANNPIPTDNPTHIPTVPFELMGLRTPNFNVSIGNRGVPTDKPTDRQTNQQTDKNPKNNSFEQASAILNTLDSIKKEIRLKFKRLTSQEMQVFTMLYSLENQGIEEISYKLLAQNLNLSESSIRDYITKLTAKGIPIVKTRENNKKISLKISPDLQKIANLSTIIKLREL